MTSSHGDRKISDRMNLFNEFTSVGSLSNRIGTRRRRHEKFGKVRQVIRNEYSRGLIHTLIVHGGRPIAVKKALHSARLLKRCSPGNQPNANCASVVSAGAGGEEGD